MKTFHCEIQNDHDAIATEEKTYRDIPSVRTISQNEILRNYQRIKEDIKTLVEDIIDQ